MKINNIFVFGDAQLIIKNIKNIYQTKNPILRAYMNEVQDVIDNLFFGFNIT